MLNIFIGWDETETLAYHVLAHSIIRRASQPVRITPVKRSHLGGLYTRERHPTESTEFSLTRFLVPYLSSYEGYSIFMDCDMLVLDDITKVLGLTDQHDQISVVKHSYVPSTTLKMGGKVQTSYARKNWSSFMIFNNARCRVLTPEVVNTDSGLHLHRFSRFGSIGSLPLEWNWLVGEYKRNSSAKILHYTLGGPWMKGYENCPHHDLWDVELANLKGE